MLAPVCMQPRVVQPLPALLGQPLAQSAVATGRCASPAVRGTGLARRWEWPAVREAGLARHASPSPAEAAKERKRLAAGVAQESTAAHCPEPSREEIEREMQRLTAEATGQGVQAASRPSSPVARLASPRPSTGSTSTLQVTRSSLPARLSSPARLSDTGSTSTLQSARLSSPSRGSNSAVPRGLAENLKGRRGASPAREALAPPMLDVRDPDVLAPPLELEVHDPDEDVQFDLCVLDPCDVPADLCRARRDSEDDEDKVALEGSFVLKELEDSLDQSAMSMVIRNGRARALTATSFGDSLLEESFGAQSVMSMVIRDDNVQSLPQSPASAPRPLAPTLEVVEGRDLSATSSEVLVPTIPVPAGSIVVAQEITAALASARSNAANAAVHSSASPVARQPRLHSHSRTNSSARTQRREDALDTDGSRSELEQKLLRAVAQLEAKLASCAHVQKAYESAYSAASLRRERCEASVDETERTLAGLEEQEKRCKAQGSTLVAGSSLRQNWEAKLKCIEDKRDVAEQNLLGAMSELKREQHKEQTAKDDIRKSIQESRATFQALDELRGSPNQFQQVRRSMKEPISAVRAASPTVQKRSLVSQQSSSLAFPEHVRKSIRESRATFQALDELSSSTPTSPSTGCDTRPSTGRNWRGARNSDISPQSIKPSEGRAKRAERHSDPSGFRSFGSSLGRFFRKSATDHPKFAEAMPSAQDTRVVVNVRHPLPLPATPPEELAAAADQEGESDESTSASGHSSRESADLQGRLAALPLEELRDLLLALPAEHIESAFSGVVPAAPVSAR